MRLRTIAGGAVLMLGLLGCPGDGDGGGSVPAPTITISDLTCPASDIAVTATAVANRVSPPPGSQWTVDVTVTVTCRNEPVRGAKISVGYWWSSDLISVTTDENGQATNRQSTSGQPPADAEVEVTLTPDQGDPMTQTVSVTVTSP